MKRNLCTSTRTKLRRKAASGERELMGPRCTHCRCYITKQCTCPGAVEQWMNDTIGVRVTVQELAKMQRMNDTVGVRVTAQELAKMQSLQRKYQRQAELDWLGR